MVWTDRAYELGVASGDPNASLDADLARSIVEGIRGDSAAAIEYATKAAAVAERVDNKACAMVAHGVIGEQYLRDGDAARAAIAFEASADLAAFCQFMPVKIEQTELLLQTARADRRRPGGVRALRARPRTRPPVRRPARRGAVVRAAARDRMEPDEDEMTADDLSGPRRSRRAWRDSPPAAGPRPPGEPAAVRRGLIHRLDFDTESRRPPGGRGRAVRVGRRR